MKKNIHIVITVILIIIILAGLFWYFKLRNVFEFNSDVNIQGDYTVDKDERLVLKNGAVLEVEGDLIVKGEIACEAGPLNLVVGGIVTIENKLECNRGSELAGDDLGLGISVVFGSGFETAEDSKIITNGHLQIVNDIEKLAVTKKALEDLYEEAGKDSGSGNRLGPFVPLPQDQAVISEELNPFNFLIGKNLASIASFFKIKEARAFMLPIRGNITINTPPKGISLIILFQSSNIEGFLFEDLNFTGPNGNDGDDAFGCYAEGEDGQDAMRLLAYAPKIVIDNVTLNLASGGNGGTATTPMDGCQDAVAIGGDGGKSGEFKFIASNEFIINNSFVIYPGKSGDAGDAFAYGKNGALNEPGGTANASGGNSASNKKAIRSIGTIAGTENIQIGSVIGGDGGSAWALGGHGGDGDPCPKNGQPGGYAKAIAGQGAEALIYLTGTGASRTAGAVDVNGKDGSVDAVAGSGGNGAEGGKGGKGGKASVEPQASSEVKRVMDGIDGEDGIPSDCKKVISDPLPAYCGDGNCDKDEGECCISCPEDCPVCEEF